jgi:hypothetical protein
MDKVNLKQVDYKGISVKVPEIWNVVTESYSEPDGRECAMMDISAVEGDPRSIVISYGPMPEGSDALFEAGGTYDELMEDLGADAQEDPICEYDFLGTTAYGFEFPTEDGLACNFICVSVDPEDGSGCKLFTILTTAKEFEDIDDLLDLIEENVVLK